MHLPKGLLQWGRPCEGAERAVANYITAEHRYRFNGAAPVKGRKEHKIGGSQIPHRKLQWGRPCEGAERRTLTTSYDQHNRLQWGRPCEGAERHSCSTRSIASL